MALITLADPVPPSKQPKHRFALFALGFRPFYLLAATFAAIAIPVWGFVLAGRLAMPMPGVYWHAHEMIFGFAAAVVVGFLFTAGRNWTGLQTPTGLPLAALALLWLAGRLAMACDGGPLTALVDFAFLPAAAVALGRLLWRAGSRKNFFIVGILALLSFANLAFHGGRLGWIEVSPLAALHGALALLVMLETAIGGRVIPSFTASAVRGVRQWRPHGLDIAAIAANAVALAGWALFPAGAIGALLLAVAAGLQLLHWIGWNPAVTWRHPLLWSLHAAYFWIPAGLALLALAQIGVLPRSAGVHALTIGATGGLIVAMITRTALGHTGRLLVAGAVETAAYALVQLAALARVATLVLLPAATLAGIHLAALAWTLAFALYVGRYLPFLVHPRSDGQPG